MATTTYTKAPPVFNKGDNYSKWKKKLGIWKTLTSFEKTKQGPSLVLSLDDESQDAVLELTEQEISAEGGVDNIIKVLDDLYLKDKTESAFEAFEAFEGYRRPKGLSMNDYCNEFDKRHNKVKSYGTVLPKDLLGFRLLKSANLQPHQEELAKATVGELNYDNMKAQLKKIHGSDSSKEVKQEVNVEGDLVEADVLYGKMYSGRGGRFQRHQSSHGSTRPYRGGPSRPYRGGQYRKGRNPPDEYGNTSTCLECGSVNHWASKCPDKGKNVKDNNTLHCEQEQCDKQRRDYDKVEDTFYHITLFQSDFDEPYRLKSLVADTMNCGVLDCGASETVCGNVWFNCYLDSLDKVDRDKVEYRKSKNVFKFGDGKRVESTKQASIPATIGSSKVTISTDIVDSDIPLLLSKRAMKNADTELNFKDDTAMILGEKVNL